MVKENGILWGVRYFTDTRAMTIMFFPEEEGYSLFSSTAKAPTPPPADLPVKDKKRMRSPKVYKEPSEIRWEKWIPIRVPAMVKTGDTLFVVGPTDKVKKDDPLASFEGRMGSILQAYDANDGTERMKTELKEMPVFDGMIAANSMIYISTINGTVIALTP